MLVYYVMKLISKIFCVLPWSVGRAFGNVLGRVALIFVPEWRMQMAAANVQECLHVSQEEARKIAVQSVVKFGRMVIEVLRFPLLTGETIQSVVKTDGLEYLEEAYAKGKGALMCTGHFGNWELLGADVALHGYPMLSIARKQNNSAMDRFINEYRELVGQKVAYNEGREGVLAMGRYLKEKHLLGILFDQDTNDTGVKINLFGKEVITPSGPAVFSRTRRLVLRYSAVPLAARSCRFLCIMIRTAAAGLKSILLYMRKKQRIKTGISIRLRKS